MPATFLVIPQWQGSGSSRAMRLLDGADAIRGDLPVASTTVVEVPLEAGDSRASGVSRLGSIEIVRDRALAALAELPDRVLTVGGDCGVELAAVGHALTRTGGNIAVVWFDAHPDLNTARTSPSSAFCGMVLRTLLGDGEATLVPSTTLAPGNVILAGVRSTDDGEADFVAASGITRLGVGELSVNETSVGETSVGETSVNETGVHESGSPQSGAAALVAAIEKTGSSAVYLHVDLDVLDPSELAGLSDPIPFGLEASNLVALIRAVTSRFAIAGAGITSYSPASEADAIDDLPTILRIIGALSS